MLRVLLMGFFSWDCTRCDRSIRGLPAVRAGGGTDRWMADAVALLPNGDRTTGTYDGYGYLGSLDLVELDGVVELRHVACDEVAGSPPYTEPSLNASDQGFFIDPEDNPPDPRSAT